MGDAKEHHHHKDMTKPGVVVKEATKKLCAYLWTQ